MVVRNQVVEGKAVVASQEIDAAVGVAQYGFEQRRAAADALGCLLCLSAVAFDEAADIVAVAAIPLGPLVADKGAQLVLLHIPCLGDNLGRCQRRVGLNGPQDRWVGYRFAILIAREHRGQVETEAVDMHFAHPVAQAIQDHAAHDGVVGIQGIACAGEIVIIMAVVLFEQVVSAVFDAFEGKGGPFFIPFASMIEDDVEDDLNARPV